MDLNAIFLALVMIGIYASNDVAGKTRKGEGNNEVGPPPGPPSDDNMMMNNMNRPNLMLMEEYNYAECVLVNNAALDEEKAANNNINGNISLKQRKSGQGPVHVRMQMKGMDPDGSVQHGFHVHQYGDLTNGCNSAGGHFNPAGKTHGAPEDAERHVGDWGNIDRNADDAVDMQMIDHLTSLAGGENYIVGRAIVLHAKMDDLGKGGDAGSLATGNAGARLACCVIGLTGDKDW